MNPTNPSNSFTPIIPIDPSITLVHHFLERSARLYPDKVAIIHGKVRATYSEINTRADNLAHYLQSIATQKGDRIALLMENCVEYVISYYGIMKAGAVAVPLNSDLKPEGLRYAIEDLNANVLISSSRFEKLIDAPSSDLGSLDLIMKGSTHSSTQRSTTHRLIRASTDSRSAPCAMRYACLTFSLHRLVFSYELSAISYEP